ncbi:hypothetical protein M407DRAFT_9052 [Tulasnella calospora MUT 4182]|uniref:Uncharacterized protein n=1 Tax=Tulasnella calospora MUT 4182 TaxID=1051891 RepID=A0A0C3QFV2_9AGAM|nr:hypothetical protein M407DRAFT_9052 [Tulasnella calospora MUT 4182]
MLAVLPQVDRLYLYGPDRQGGRPHLNDATRYAPSTIPWPQHSSRTFNLQNGLQWPEGGRMDVVGPKHDLLLLLSHLQCRLPDVGMKMSPPADRRPVPLDRHQNENRKFLIFTDFDLEFEDYTGFPGAIPRIAATRHDIVCPKATNTNAKHEAHRTPLQGESHPGYNARAGERG